MLVSSDAGAAQIVSDRDDTRFYDDVGCAAADWRAHQHNTTAFVRANGGDWMDVRAASFGRPATAQTAMASGFVAYASAGEAKAADRDGRALTWGEVVDSVGERP
jgi:hypothetical protein